jgi:RHH-type transcriptional regulator, rel operon repressor / antitoxin RelB
VPSITFTVRIDSGVKKRMDKLAKSTGRSRSFIAAEAIGAYLDSDKGYVEGIKRAIESMDRGEGVSHEQVKAWIGSWGTKNELPIPKRSRR